MANLFSTKSLLFDSWNLSIGFIVTEGIVSYLLNCTYVCYRLEFISWLAYLNLLLALFLLFLADIANEVLYLMLEVLVYLYGARCHLLPSLILQHLTALLGQNSLEDVTVLVALLLQARSYSIELYLRHIQLEGVDRYRQ